MQHFFLLNQNRAQSVRRTSLRDKTLTTKKDAVEEARLRLQAQEVFIAPDSTTMDPNGGSAQIVDDLSLLSNGLAAEAALSSANYNNNNNTLSTNNNSNSGSSSLRNSEEKKSSISHHQIYGGASSTTTGTTLLSHSISADGIDASSSSTTNAGGVSVGGVTTHSYITRRPPDGRENDELQMSTYKSMSAGGVEEHQRSTSATAIIMADRKGSATEALQINSSNRESANGKINVQVTVLVGKLARFLKNFNDGVLKVGQKSRQCFKPLKFV